MKLFRSLYISLLVSAVIFSVASCKGKSSSTSKTVAPIIMPGKTPDIFILNVEMVSYPQEGNDGASILESKELKFGVDGVLHIVVQIRTSDLEKVEQRIQLKQDTTVIELSGGSQQKKTAADGVHLKYFIRQTSAGDTAEIVATYEISQQNLRLFKANKPITIDVSMIKENSVDTRSFELTYKR